MEENKGRGIQRSYFQNPKETIKGKREGPTIKKKKKKRIILLPSLQRESDEKQGKGYEPRKSAGGTESTIKTFLVRVPVCGVFSRRRKVQEGGGSIRRSGCCGHSLSVKKAWGQQIANGCSKLRSS